MIERARHLLKSVFGYDRFISLQQDVIQNVLGGRDTLVVMPTGGGKSLCYQLPALVLDGLTVVVSPLISLMQDQVEQLAELGIPAVLLNSSLSLQAYRRNVDRLRRGEAKLLYVAPETLLKPNVLALLESLSVVCAAIDEAHCISEWGPDFRPEYRQLATIRSHLPRAAIIALTATATPRVRKDIRECLGLDQSGEFIAGFDRDNLLIRVVQKANPLRQAVELLERYPNESGIIYCSTRKGVDGLCGALRAQGFSVSPYHAGLSETDRIRNQARFSRDEVRVIVATIAFGMGINKSNVRFVLHYDLPGSIDSYYQEIGRAGRDGMRAECLLLFSPADVFKFRSFLDGKNGIEKRAAELRLNAMVQFAEADVCRRIPLLSHFGETYPREHCGRCDNCLAGEREKTDATVAAQKFLSCVKRTGECFGSVHIIDVLRGSKAGRVLKLGHDSLSTHGIGREYSRAQWQQLSRQFLHQGFLAQDAQFGGLSLTPQGWEVLRGKTTVMCRLDASKRPDGHLEEDDENRHPGYDRRLFEILRTKRKELADAANVPPFVIFSDRTLAEIAACYPETPDDMFGIHGIGEAKRVKYGATFSKIISDYCREHDIREKPRSPMVRTPARDERKEGNRRQRAVGRAFNAGQSVESLAKEWNVKQSRIIHHLRHYVGEGHPLRSDGLLPLVNLPDRQVSGVIEAFERLGTDFLRPVFDALNGEVAYDDLHIIRLYVLSRRSGGVDPNVLEREGWQYRKIVCLASSRKYSGCCIAGKESLKGYIGGWIRPVSATATGELSFKEVMIRDGRAPQPLDVIMVPLGEDRRHGCQTENRLVGGGRWTWNGKFPLDRLPELVDRVDRLWINGYLSRDGMNDRIPEELARNTLESSLLFIRPEDLRIVVREGVRGLNKVWARFTHQGQPYCLSVTDPVAENRYMRMDVGDYAPDCLQPYLTLSISEPFEGFCYKLVACIIPLQPAPSE